MKDLDDIKRRSGWKPGLWNDPFSKRYVKEEKVSSTKIGLFFRIKMWFLTRKK